MTATTSTSHTLFTCPACDKEVAGRLSLDFELGEVKGKEVKAAAKVTGLQVSHDCTPKVTRGDKFTATWNGER